MQNKHFLLRQKNNAYRVASYTKKMNNSEQKSLRGVNLGGWLVLEKWMTPSLFVGTNAHDEYSLVRTKNAAEKIQKHRETFITEADFQWMHQRGIDIIRLPVGFWALDDHPPLISAKEKLDWTFQMAEKYNIQILVCLHAAYGSQNGKDHSGKMGQQDWYVWQHRRKTTQSLLRLVKHLRYSQVFWGIEVLNEPMPVTARQERQLRRWTRRIVRRLNAEAKNIRVVFSDAFQPEIWTGAINHSCATMDVHHYQAFSETDKQLTLEQHIKKAHYMRRSIATWQQDQPVIIGEWSLGLDVRSLSGVARRHAEQQFGEAQLEAFAQAEAWFFWSYKTEREDGWNFRYLIEQKILQI